MHYAYCTVCCFKTIVQFLLTELQVYKIMHAHLFKHNNYYTETKTKMCIYVHLLIKKYVLCEKIKLELFQIINKSLFFTIIFFAIETKRP